MKKQHTNTYFQLNKLVFYDDLFLSEIGMLKRYFIQ